MELGWLNKQTIKVSYEYLEQNKHVISSTSSAKLVSLGRNVVKVITLLQVCYVLCAARLMYSVCKIASNYIISEPSVMHRQRGQPQPVNLIDITDCQLSIDTLTLIALASHHQQLIKHQNLLNKLSYKLLLTPALPLTWV